MENLYGTARLHKDFLANSLRREIEAFQDLMRSMEKSGQREAQDIREALRISGKMLHSLNRSLANVN